MATQTINYTDKAFLNENQSIADINKIKDVDMNEIKSVVNNNANELDEIYDRYESGYVASSQMTSATIGGTASRTYDLVFTNTYTTPPTVIVSTYHNANLGTYGFIQCAVNNITATGCKLLFANNMSNNDYGINYLVISKD